MKKLWSYIMALMIADCLDVISTTTGLLIGLHELSPLFLMFPGGWVLLDIALIIFILKFPAPGMDKIKNHLTLIVVIATFLPFLNNVVMISLKLGGI